MDDILGSVPKMGEELECSSTHEPDEITAKNITVVGVYEKSGRE